MKLLLIAPAPLGKGIKPGQSPSWQKKAHRFSQYLGLMYVAAVVPDDVEVQIVDENIEPIDFNNDADLIGITSMTAQAPRAYEIADAFRQQGRTVILGGFHPTFMPQEAMEHADALCIGEAENTVPRMIMDFKKRKLSGMYTSELVDLRHLPMPRRDMLSQKNYFTNAIIASRGCNHTCTYCSESTFYKHKYRIRPIEAVLTELQTLGKYVLFMDSNIVGSKPFAMRLFKRMKSMNKRWASQCCIEIANDDELLKAAAESGCTALFLGFESLSKANLERFNKSFNLVDRFETQIKKIHDHGIGIMASFIFGNDDDDMSAFDRTLEFMEKNRIEALHSMIMTPFPGTKMYDEMDRAGRIIDKDWSKYDFHHVVFKPKSMTAEQLQQGNERLRGRFYATKRFLKRIFSASHLSIETVVRVLIPVNLGYWVTRGQ